MKKTKIDRPKLIDQSQIDDLSSGISNEWPGLSFVVESLDSLKEGKTSGEILEEAMRVERGVHFAVVEARLRCQVPHLFELRLEGQLQGRIEEGITQAINQAKKHNSALQTIADDELGGYAIAINQTYVDDKSSVEGARDYLEQEGGIEKTGYGMRQRFLMYGEDDQSKPGAKEIIRRAIVGGYFKDPYLGRFIAVVPLLGEEVGSPYIDVALDAAGVTRERQRASDGVDRSVLGSKYVAYYIDGNGSVWQNNSFMRFDQPDFSQINQEK